MLNASDVAVVNPLEVASKVYPVPALLILKSLNVATPLEAAFVSVPLSVPLPALLFMAIVTLSVAEVTRLSFASRIRTVTAGEIELPAVVFVGCWLKTSFVAVPTVMLNALDVAVVNEPEVTDNVYPVPELLMFKSLNVATPLEAAFVSVPLSVPLPALLAMAIVTLSVAEVTRLSFTSRIRTVTAGEIELPAAVFDGCWLKTSFVAVPTVMSNASDVAVVNPLEVASKVYPVPALLMLKSLNVATPLDAVWGVVPDNVPLPGLLFMAIATLVLLSDVRTLFHWSLT